MGATLLKGNFVHQVNNFRMCNIVAAATAARLQFIRNGGEYENWIDELQKFSHEMPKRARAPVVFGFVCFGWAKMDAA